MKAQFWKDLSDAIGNNVDECEKEANKGTAQYPMFITAALVLAGLSDAINVAFEAAEKRAKAAEDERGNW